MKYRIKQYMSDRRDTRYYFRHLDMTSGEQTEDYFYMASEENFIKYLNTYNKQYIKNKRNLLIWPVYELTNDL